MSELETVGITLLRIWGESIFIPTKYKNESSVIQGIRPSEWSVSQLRAMANYMEQNRDVSLFPDGSGETIKD